MKGIVGRLIAKKLRISGEEVEGRNNNRNEIAQEEPFPAEIEEAIRNRIAVAAVDTLVDERYMAACWVVITLENEIR